MRPVNQRGTSDSEQQESAERLGWDRRRSCRRVPENDGREHRHQKAMRILRIDRPALDEQADGRPVAPESPTATRRVSERATGSPIAQAAGPGQGRRANRIGDRVAHDLACSVVDRRLPALRVARACPQREQGPGRTRMPAPRRCMNSNGLWSRFAVESCQPIRKGRPRRLRCFVANRHRRPMTFASARPNAGPAAVALTAWGAWRLRFNAGSRLPRQTFSKWVRDEGTTTKAARNSDVKGVSFRKRVFHSGETKGEPPA